MILVIPLLVATLGGVVLFAIGWMGRDGRLRPNQLAGIRTPYTHSSDEAWYATHRHAGIPMILGSAAVVALGLAFVPFVAADVVPAGVVVAVLLVQVALALLTAIGSWLYATNAARRELARG